MTHLIAWSIILFWNSGGFMDTHTAFPTKAACLHEAIQPMWLWPLGDAKRVTCWPVQLRRS
jgi:hypothetical protein